VGNRGSWWRPRAGNAEGGRAGLPLSRARRLGWWTGQHVGQVGLGRWPKRVLGRNAELGRGVRESKVKKRNELFKAVQDVREHEIEKRDGWSELNLFIERGWLGLHDAQTEASNGGHPVLDEIQNSTS
jgi:hypothetical protein